MERRGWRVGLRAKVVAVAVMPMVGVAVLHWLGRLAWMRVEWSHFFGWLSGTPLEDSLAALMRSGALVAAYWLAGSTLIYLVARAGRFGSLADAVGRVTLPSIRRMADRALAGALLVTTAATPLAASRATEITPVVVTVDLPFETIIPLPDPETSDVVPQEDGQVPDTGPVDKELPVVALPFEAGDPGNPGDPDALGVATSDQEPYVSAQVDVVKAHDRIEIVVDASLTVVVRPGDHLWDLAAQRLTEAFGRPAADHEIAPYWLQVMSANRDRLESGDPDLIYPGEVIVLPPVKA